MKLLQLLEIAPQQRVIGHDQIVLRNLAARMCRAAPLSSTSTFKCA